MKPAREPASSSPKPCACLKKPHESCPFAAPCGPRRKKNDCGQTSAFNSRLYELRIDYLIREWVRSAMATRKCGNIYFRKYFMASGSLQIFLYFVVVFFTLTDRASAIPSNIRGCQSGTWSAGQKEIRGTSTKLHWEQKKNTNTQKTTKRKEQE